jgi:hypothetical protein
MKKVEFKITWFLLALIVCLALFLGLYQVYQARVIENPIIKEVSELSNVEKVHLSKQQDVLTIEVTLNKSENIKTDYEKVYETINPKVKKKNYRIKLIDKRDPILQKEWDDLQLSIYEAMAKDNYLWLEQQVKKRSEEDHSTYKLYLDEHRLYLQLDHQKGFLYEVIERPIKLNE